MKEEPAALKTDLLRRCNLDIAKEPPDLFCTRSSSTDESGLDAINCFERVSAGVAGAYTGNCELDRVVCDTVVRWRAIAYEGFFSAHALAIVTTGIAHGAWITVIADTLDGGEDTAFAG